MLPGNVLALTVCFLVIIWVNLQRVHSESILAIKGVGIQLKTRRFSGAESVEFIDKKLVSDILILEGLTRFQVLYYLAINVKGQNSLAVIFKVSKVHR